MEWLKSYFGKDWQSYQPLVLLEDDEYAVVRIVKPMPAGFSNSAIILINKTETFEAGHRVVLGDSWTPEVKERAEEYFAKTLKHV